MENRDVIITTGLEAFEKKLNDLKKPEENYKFKTNCKFKDKNIKTLNRKELTELIVRLFVWKDTVKMISEAHPDRFNSDDMKIMLTDIDGFSFSDWESDMFYLLDKIKYNEAKKDIEAKANALRNFYSEEKKTDMAINEILASL
jgi:hypothetical protein